MGDIREHNSIWMETFLNSTFGHSFIQVALFSNLYIKSKISESQCQFMGPLFFVTWTSPLRNSRLVHCPSVLCVTQVVCSRSLEKQKFGKLDEMYRWWFVKPKKFRRDLLFGPSNMTAQGISSMQAIKGAKMQRKPVDLNVPRYTRNLLHEAVVLWHHR